MKTKLLAIQSELKAPKDQKNTHMGFYYRSCEDILENVKPILKKHNCCLIISDEIIIIGDRIYVKATATISDNKPEPDRNEFISVSAFAREPEIQKGLNEAQITGLASSYARKYALNGLFLIDDSEEADDNKNSTPIEKQPGDIKKALEAIGKIKTNEHVKKVSEMIDQRTWTEEESRQLEQSLNAMRSTL